jgi:hypothetical protein
MVLYSVWKLQPEIVIGVLEVGAVAVPKGMEFTQPTGPEHEVHAMVVLQQMEAVPQAAFVL